MGAFNGSFYSESLGMNTRLAVIFPDESNDVTREIPGEPRVLYLLHGLSGNCEEWMRFSKIEYYAKKYNLIVVMPDAGRSFYCDLIGGPRYFTYVADELPALCAKWFRMDAARENTFIAGESMGGYGAVKIALRRPGRFSAAASLSGVLDYPAMAGRVLRGEWAEMHPRELTALHGPDGVPVPEDNVLYLVRKLAERSDRPRLLQLCGTEDFLYEDNQTFRRAADGAGYGHVYREGTGEHAWPYWDRAIQQAIWFFLGLDEEAAVLY